jgi:hypothetical protein
MIYTSINYATRCMYLCYSVHCVKILHANKFRMSEMCDERKWIIMHGNKKILFRCFIFSINIELLQQSCS